MARQATPRTYHSTALLLPDGRVFSGGGGLCGNCGVDHADGEISSPPYLFRGPRPVIRGAPPAVGYNAPFSIATTGGVARFTFVRLSSTTHTVNTDQRFLPAKFVRRWRFVYRHLTLEHQHRSAGLLHAVRAQCDRCAVGLQDRRGSRHARTREQRRPLPLHQAGGGFGGQRQTPGARRRSSTSWTGAAIPSGGRVGWRARTARRPQIRRFRRPTP